VIAALLLLAAGAMPAATFHCGAVTRPGVAELGEDGVWRGTAVDLCRQRAGNRVVEFHLYETPAALAAAGNDDLAVLSPAEIAAAHLAPQGAPLTVSRQVLLVKPGAPIERAEALAGRRVCLLVASAAESALDRWARERRIAIVHAGFQEPVELRDGFDAGYCAAMAVDAADVPGGPARTRALAPALAEVPLYALARRR